MLISKANRRAIYENLFKGKFKVQPRSPSFTFVPCSPFPRRVLFDLWTSR